MTPIHEHLSRSVAKAITFRFMILCSDSIIIYFITHRLDTALEVLIASNVASTLLYIFHERIWNGVHWGKEVVVKVSGKRNRHHV